MYREIPFVKNGFDFAFIIPLRFHLFVIYFRLGCLKSADGNLMFETFNSSDDSDDVSASSGYLKVQYALASNSTR